MKKQFCYILYTNEDQRNDICGNSSLLLRLLVKYRVIWELKKPVSSNLWLCNQRTLLNIFYVQDILSCTLGIQK